MIRDTIAGATSFAQLVAAGLLALVGARFAVHGVLFAVKDRAPSLEHSETPVPSPMPTPKSSATASAAPSASSPSGVKLGSTLRVPIVVNSPAPRAEVRIDGILVGNTPYVGEVTCRAGEKIQIDVSPSKGAPKRHEGTCALGTLHVSD